MDKLWAPWRLTYIRSKRQKKCIFCAAKINAARYKVVFKTKYSLCMLNAYPYNNGHLMISPLRHTSKLLKLKDEELLDLMRSLDCAKNLLAKAFKPHGYNIGINISRDAGAGVTGHLHIHIVPRWRGDTNFMPLLSNTKIISQSLEEALKQLKDAKAG